MNWNNPNQTTIALSAEAGL